MSTDDGAKRPNMALRETRSRRTRRCPGGCGGKATPQHRHGRGGQGSQAPPTTTASKRHGYSARCRRGRRSSRQTSARIRALMRKAWPLRSAQEARARRERRLRPRPRACRGSTDRPASRSRSWPIAAGRRQRRHRKCRQTAALALTRRGTLRPAERRQEERIDIGHGISIRMRPCRPSRHRAEDGCACRGVSARQPGSKSPRRKRPGLQFDGDADERARGGAIPPSSAAFEKVVSSQCM